MADTALITLAGTEYTVRRLNLRQMRDLQIGAVKAVTEKSDDLATNVMQAFESDVGILATALGRDHPELTAEKIYDMETTREEIGAAAVLILKFSGLIPKGDKPGEAGAAPE